METVHGVTLTVGRGPMQASFRFPESDVWVLHDAGFHVGSNLSKIKCVKYGEYYSPGAYVESKMKNVALPRSYLIRQVDMHIKYMQHSLDTMLVGHPRISRRYREQLKKLETFRKTLERNERLVGIRKKVAARSIQRQFKESISNPGYRMCKNRLLREFESMTY